jgi:hypothetical protein
MWKIILKNWFTWITLTGAILSIYAFFSEHEGFALTIISITVLALFWTSFHYYKRTYKLRDHIKQLEEKLDHLTKKYGRQYAYFHEIIHQVRDALHIVNLQEVIRDKKKISEIRAKIAKIALNEVSSVFSKLVGNECTASIMLRNPKNPDLLVTKIWSDNVTSERRDEKNRTELPIGRGLAGKAFQTGVVQWSNDFEKCVDFIGMREKWQEFYLSGFSTPFRMNGEVMGVFNVDCLVTDLFCEEMRFIAQMGGDLIALSYQLEVFLNDFRKT